MGELISQLSLHPFKELKLTLTCELTMNRKRLAPMFLIALVATMFLASLSGVLAQYGGMSPVSITGLADDNGRLILQTLSLDGSAGYNQYSSNYTWSIPYGNPMIFRALADAGYTFDYYSFTGDAGSGTTTQEIIYTNAYTDFTITAHFKAVTSNTTVTFTDNTGGNVAIGHSTFVFNGYIYSFSLYPSYVLPENSTVLVDVAPNINYKVDHITVTQNGANTTYYGNSVQLSTTDLTAVIVYYAVGGDWSMYSPSVSPDYGLGFSGFLDLTTTSGIYVLVTYLVGLIVSFVGLVILLKAPSAWIVGLIFISVGLIVCMASWTNIFALAGWALTVLISPIFLYAGGKGGK